VFFEIYFFVLLRILPELSTNLICAVATTVLVVNNFENVKEQPHSRQAKRCYLEDRTVQQGLPQWFSQHENCGGESSCVRSDVSLSFYY